MERICPFLATSEDARAVIDGFDPGHRCRAVESSEPLDRSQQIGVCLEAAHLDCERFQAFARSDPALPGWPPPAPDAGFVQTRLVLAPRPALQRLVAGGRLAPAARRWALGGALATVGIAAVASGVAGGLGSLVDGAGPDPIPTESSEPSVQATQRPAIGGPTSAAPTIEESEGQPTPEATITPATSAPPSTSVAPTAAPRTYVVQPGDTLNGIAIRFGTSVAVIQEANGMGGTDVILVGQVLVIP